MDSRDYTSFGLDNHDVDDKVQKIAKSLLNSRTIKSQKEQKVLAIGAIDDDTSDGIDTEIIATELIKHLSDSEKFLVVNAGRDKNVEEMIRDARKLRKDAEYNQYTTIEAGNLISPHYALTGKITERTKSVGEDEIKEYVFVFKLTDLTRGAVRWVSTERISKKLAKSEVENFQESKSYGTDYSKYLPDGYAPSYSYKPSYSQKDNEPSAWEKFKDFFSADGKNYFVLGFDLGLGAGGVYANSIEFDVINIDYNNKEKRVRKIETRSAWGFIAPITLRMGYLRDSSEDWAFGINFLYNYMSLTDSNLDSNFIAKIHRIGSDFVFYYKALNWLHLYVGVGVLADIGSQYKQIFDYSYYNKEYSSSSYIRTNKYINTIGQDKLKVEGKLYDWYLPIKFGILWNINDYFGVTTDITIGLLLREVASFNYWGFVAGLQFKI